MKLLLSIIFSLTAITAYSQTNIFPATGSAGIGTTAPKAKLDVAAYVSDGALSTVLARQLEGNNMGGGTYLGVKGYGTQNSYGRKSFSIEHSFYGQINSSINFHRGDAEAGGYIVFATNNNAERMVIATNGNVGIGTTSPQAKLAVNGNILAKEIKVKTDISVPDYVFEPEYKMLSLAEIENYVKEHKHLPEIPSAKQIGEEGLDLAEMNLGLLKKVEELTLILIQKDKIQTQQSEKISDQEERIKALERASNIKN